VRGAIERSPHRSARRHSVSLGLSEASVRRILHKYLHFYPYKIQVTHALHERYYVNRVNFCQTFFAVNYQNQELVNNLLMSDEAHFHLSGFVNKQNFRYWSAINPRELHERPLHGSKVTVWCAISSFGIIGPYFFEDERERAVTMNGPRYVHVGELLRSRACSSSSNRRNVFPTRWSYEPHHTRFHGRVRNLFSNHVISRYGDITWPARSPDLSACDFLLWGYLKSQVFKAPAPHTVQDLKHRILQEVKRIPVEMLQRAMGDVRKRLTECLERNGGHLNDVIFGK